MAVSSGPLLDVAAFRTRLMIWYDRHARELPWRGIDDPYRTWVSEVMLQQTRVAAVIDHYGRFLARFPTLETLAQAEEPEVLAVWSGLGYYRRARMMHKAAQFVVVELAGRLPETATALRVLPGIGEYTSAAIASIAFGESVAVLDGNVERVLLRVAGRAEEPGNRAFVREQAAALVPPAVPGHNAPGDHNQAMMELGATLCLPRAPLCLHCPVVALCRTRGEHFTPVRAKAVPRDAAFLFETRRRSGGTEVLLAQRPTDASLMAGMFELPPLPLDAVVDQEPVLKLRHAITTTLYSVAVFTGKELRKAIPANARDLHWIPATRLGDLPLTGLCRKALKRLALLQG